MSRIGARQQTSALLAAVVALTAGSLLDRPARGTRPVPVAVADGLDDGELRAVDARVSGVLGRSTRLARSGDDASALEAVVSGRARIAAVGRVAWGSIREEGAHPALVVAKRIDGGQIDGIVLICRPTDELAPAPQPTS